MQLALARQAEVEDLHLAVAGQEEVVGLEVAVHDAAGVRGGEPGRDLRGDLERLARRQRAADQALAQRLAVEQLHRGEGDLAVLAEIEDRQDVRMRERRDRLGLALEARQRVGVGGEMRRQDLDRHLAVELGVAGAEDLAHPALAELGDDLVGAEPGSDHRVARSWRAGGIGALYFSATDLTPRWCRAYL